MNDLLILLKLYPKRIWDMQWLSVNPNISWNIVKAHPEYGWDFSWLSQNLNITQDTMEFL